MMFGHPLEYHTHLEQVPKTCHHMGQVRTESPSWFASPRKPLNSFTGSGSEKSDVAFSMSKSYTSKVNVWCLWCTLKIFMGCCKFSISAHGVGFFTANLFCYANDPVND